MRFFYTTLFLWFDLSSAFTPSCRPTQLDLATTRQQNGLMMAIDDAMVERLTGIKRSYQALTERLGDPDVIEDSRLLMKIMSDRSKSEDVVNAFDEVS